VLLDPCSDLDLPLFQSTCFFIVFVLSNPLCATG
jgi:hypothetical protein